MPATIGIAETPLNMTRENAVWSANDVIVGSAFKPSEKAVSSSRISRQSIARRSVLSHLEQGLIIGVSHDVRVYEKRKL